MVNLPDAPWRKLSGIDVFLTRGTDRAKLDAALTQALSLEPGAIVDADNHALWLQTLGNHPVMVVVFALASPRFGWKCDIGLQVPGDMRARLKALAACLGTAFMAMDESDAYGDALVVFHPDGTWTKDHLGPDDVDGDDATAEGRMKTVPTRKP